MSARRAARGVRVAAALLLVAGSLTACSDEPDPPQPPQIRPQWQSVELPPAGAGRRMVLRDAAQCADRWYVVGAVAGPGVDETAPAAWTSTDAVSWTAMVIRPKTYYGRRNVLYSAACQQGRLAVVGGKVGGAHGNPRVSSWRQLPDGSLDEVQAGFELYGGPYAVNVARLVAGPRGFLITGNRTSGAAVWNSPDAAEFTIVEDVPGLATDAAGETWAFDAVPTPAGGAAPDAGRPGWLLVGGMIPKGRYDRDPLAWTSPDGRTWTRESMAGAGDPKEYDELQRVVLEGQTAVAVGLRGAAFGAWRREAGGWQAVARFGASAGRGVLRVRGLAVTGAGLLAVTNDGATHALWLSADGGRSWRTVSAPAAVPSGADSDVAAVAGPDKVLLVTDDGKQGTVWLAPAPFGVG